MKHSLTGMKETWLNRKVTSPNGKVYRILAVSFNSFRSRGGAGYLDMSDGTRVTFKQFIEQGWRY